MIILTLLLMLAASVTSAQQLAFPTAEGFGRFSEGGRGGIVCHVTSTGNTSSGAVVGDGPHHAGTFSYCMALSSRRTIVFDAAGAIDYNGGVVLANTGLVTVAGQTAPGAGQANGGISIREASVWFGPAVTGGFPKSTSDVIVRHLRVRVGVVPQNVGRSRSGIVLRSIEDGIVDHCSVAWAPDDSTGSFWSHDITFQWCFIGEGIQILVDNPSGGTELTVGKGLWIGGDGSTTSALHNLFYSSADRNPNAYETHIQFVNNLVYNGYPSRAVTDFGIGIYEFVRNYYLPGPSEGANIQYKSYPSGTASLATHNASRLWVEDNYHPTRRPDDGYPQDAILDAFVSSQRIPNPGSRMLSDFPDIPTESHQLNVRNDVLTKAGARVPAHDAVDAGWVSSLNAGTGSINPSSPPGGHPTYVGTARNLDTYDADRDGIPAAWETACSSAINTASTNHTGLSDSNEDDGALIVSTTGYSALEHYLNEVAGDYAAGSCGGLDVGGDTTAPTNVIITDPNEDDIVSGASVAFAATASDETALGTATFYQNGQLIDTDTTGSPYSITWDTTLIPDGDKILTVDVCDTSNNCTTSPTPLNVVVDNVQSYTAIHTVSAPTINGNLSEFASANLVEFNGGGGNETDCKMMYDSTNLYIGCTTTDNNLTAAVTTSDNSSIINDDSLEMVFDPDNSSGTWTSSDYKLIVNAQDAVYDAHTLSDTAWSYGGSSDATISGDLDGVADDTSWTVEVRIPWSSMSVSPSTSATYGINLQINDKDGVASTTRYRWNGTSVNTLSDAMDVMLGEPVAGGDTTDPTVGITDPIDGATIGGTYTIRADAQDESGIQDVQFYRDTSTQICSADTTAPFECVIDTTALSEATHTFHAVARDNVSPTPNDATSATITVTVDNTPTSQPSGLLVVPLYTDDGYVMSINWDDVSGSILYEIERCTGSGCSSFSLVDNSTLSIYTDEQVSRKTEYCYRIRTMDIASNPSSYSSTVCELTLDTIILDEPSTLGTTHSTTVSVLTSPSALSTNHSSPITSLGQPSTLSTTHSTNPIFLGQPSGLGTP